MNNCIFCKVNSGEIKSYKLYEDKNFIVILDRFPSSVGHALVIPKEHYKNIGNVIDTVGNVKGKALKSGRFYVVKNKPIYVNGRLYYEITLTKATDYTNKFERILMYTKYYIPDNYSIKISICYIHILTKPIF